MSKCCFELNKSLFNIDGGGGCENYEEVANFAALPATGDEDTTYKTLDDGKIFEWNGTEYVELSVQTTPIGATLMKTGQTTSYRTGDDGDIEAGRGVDFFTLSVNNPFGNTNRFTDELGGQTYTNNIVIDWSTYDGNTVLGYKRTLQPSNTMVNNLSNASGLNHAGFSSWRMWNLKEMMNIYCAKYQHLNYSPFNLSNLYIRCSTSNWETAGWYWRWDSVGGYIIYGTDTSPCAYMAVRTFTVTGTTLT